jgi:hypothetical protein
MRMALMMLRCALAPMPTHRPMLSGTSAPKCGRFTTCTATGTRAAILANSFPAELAEIEAALLAFRITQRDIGMPGGNESDMPKKFSRTLRPVGWVESRIQGDLLVRMQEYDELFLPSGKVKKVKRSESTPRMIENFIDGHKIDYVKGRVAFDLEWNSKDQTFDRDLYALRAFHECGLISAGVMVTRSEKLNPVFDVVPQLNKAGEEVGKTVRAKIRCQHDMDGQAPVPAQRRPTRRLSCPGVRHHTKTY